MVKRKTSGGVKSRPILLNTKVKHGKLACRLTSLIKNGIKMGYFTFAMTPNTTGSIGIA